jgi:hypothetical protein
MKDSKAGKERLKSQRQAKAKKDSKPGKETLKPRLNKTQRQAKK